MFGPKPRVYGFKINKQVKALARKVAFSEKAEAKKIIVLDQIKIENPSTKTYVAMLNNLGVASGKSLLVLPEADGVIYKSSRNVQLAEVTSAANVNTYEIMRAENLVLVEGAVKEIEKTFNEAK